MVSPFFVYNRFVIRYLVPKLGDILFIAIFSGAVLIGQRMLNTDGDLGRHLTLGRYVLDMHTIPVRDVLSSTRLGEPRPPYEWLAQVLFAAMDRLLRLDGVVLLAALVIGATFLVVYGDVSQRSQMPVTALLIVAWAAAASSLHWIARPHLFSFLFFAAWLQGLERIRNGKRAAWWQLPVLMLLWANTHGGFIFGFLALGAYIGGSSLWDARRASVSQPAISGLLKAGGASLVASTLTPDLWHNWDAVLSNHSAYILGQTAETMPANFFRPAFWPFAGLLLLTLLLGVVNARRLNAAHVILLSGLAAVSLAMARNIPFFSIAAAPILGLWFRAASASVPGIRQVEQRFAEMNASLPGRAWPLVAVLLAVAFFSYHSLRTKSSLYQFSSSVFPVEAAGWIKAHPAHGEIFNEFNWGGYLLYRLWPAKRVFIDSQSDFYGEQLIRAYAATMAGDASWQARLQMYDVDLIVVPTGAELAARAVASQSWRVAYADRLAIVLARK